MIMYAHHQSEPMLIKEDNVMQDKKVSRKRDRSQLNRTTSSAAPQSKKRRLVVKSVGFRNYVEIMPTPSTSNVNDWYHEADAKKFKANVKRDVLYLAKLVKENRLREMDQTEYCTIGVERYCCTQATRAQAKVLKQQRTKAIVEEQRMQQIMGISDPEMIRRVAERHSQVARNRALQLAARLAKK